MTVLVSGATGFSGQALISLLLSAGEQDIIGIARSVPENSKLNSRVRFLSCDITDRTSVEGALSGIRPDKVIHLAGLTRGNAFDLFRANISGTENLLDTVLAGNPACRILVVSSSAVYGYAGKDAIGEDAPLRPVGDYGSSKAAQEKVALERHAKHGAEIAIARPFNLVGPGQPDSFICGSIVRQVIEISRGERERLELLETTSYRDFIDVRDAVRAYCTLVSHPDFAGTCSGRAFNIGSGRAYAVSDVIALLEEITGETYIVDLPENPPVAANPFQKSDCSRIQQATGWRPEISLKQTLADMIEAARKIR